MSRPHKIYFFIGTVAEFIKLLPVLRELRGRGAEYMLISSGQNRLADNELVLTSGVGNVDVTLNERPIRKSPFALFAWFVQTFFIGIFKLRREFQHQRAMATLVVQGDTVTTLMGALIGKIFGLRVAHIEAGYRSFNFLQPFPEELDRYLTSFLADLHFCPGIATKHNLKNRRGEKVDTGYNTSLDSLQIGLTQNADPSLLSRIGGDKYFIFVMHRQENLLDVTLVTNVVQALVDASSRMKCLFVMHELTREVLRRSKLIEKLEGNDRIIVSPRIPYFEFISLLARCEFILTDGGGNQQECFYLGKPCLILRNLTEGHEGIGGNALLSGNDPAVIHEFIENYEQFLRPPIVPAVSPSRIIADALMR